MCRSVAKDLHDYSVQLNRWFLKPIGAWPRTSATSSSEKAVSRVVMLICHSLIALCIVPCELNICFEEKDIELKLRAIGPLTHWIMGGLNYCYLLLHSADIHRCMQHMEQDWRIFRQSQDREIMTRNARFGRFVAVFCAISMHGGVISYSIISSMTTVVVWIGDNQTASVLQLPFPSYSKWIDTRFSPANEIIFALQLISGLVVNSAIVGSCSLAAVFTMHACGQLDIIILRLNELVRGTNAEESKSAQQRLADIVDHHLRVLR